MALLYRMGTGNGSGSDIKPYTVNFECASGYIGQTLTMTYKGTPHAGETVDNVSGTVGSDGTLTLYPMHSGNWECSCYSSVTGITMKKTIDLSYWGVHPTVTFEDIPNGATVTPTDDVQTWLHCANIFDKQYTTVSQVVADKTTLNALVQNENANDYLVRSTTFSTTLCENNANNEAMYYLGLYDGCANKLLADDYWSNAICSADVLLADGQTHLFEKVLNFKVPTMISYTEPEGEVSASKEWTGGTLAYKAFDNNYDDYWASGSTIPAWIQYKFKAKNKVKMIVFALGDKWPMKDCILQGSNDGVSFTDIKSFTNTETTGKKDVKVICSDNMNAYLYYRLYISTTIAAGGATLSKLQFYGREEA